MASPRVVRGRTTQRLLALYLNGQGFPFAMPRGAFEPGSDITGTPGLAIEVKATRDGALTGAMKQARNYAERDLPLVVWRPDGYGPGRIEEWLVVVQLKDMVGILREAGYGDPIVPQDSDRVQDAVHRDCREDPGPAL